MSTPIGPSPIPFDDDIPAGQHYLAYHIRDREYSLWVRSDDRTLDLMLVYWSGLVEEPPQTSNVVWDFADYQMHYITPDDASLIVMAARHLKTRQGWVAYVERYIERIANRAPERQII